MATKSRRGQDPNVTAFSIVQAVTGAQSGVDVRPPEKNPAAVALGRLGGLKGGKARAASLSKKERSEIAKGGAKARWGNKNTG